MQGWWAGCWRAVVVVVGRRIALGGVGVVWCALWASLGLKLVAGVTLLVKRRIR